MTIEKLNQADIDFLTSKVKRTKLESKASLLGFIILLPVLAFIAFLDGFCTESALIGFAVILLFLNYYFSNIISKNIKQDIINNVKEMSQGTITDTYSGFGKGYVVDGKNYDMDEFAQFEVGETVRTEYVLISNTGLRIDKIGK